MRNSELFKEIKDLSAPELAIYSEQSEIKLYRINEPEPGIFIAESPKVIGRALDAGYEPISMLMDKKQTSGEAEPLIERFEADYKNTPIYVADDEVLTQITGFHLTRGVLCAMRRRVLPSVSGICENARRIAVLENVTNPTNIGAIVRSAAALGMDAVLFTYDCSDPLYRRAIRVSMGTIFQVPWTFLPRGDAPSLLREYGFKSVAMALRENSMSIDDERISSEEKLAIFLGAEGDGLLDETIKSCDHTVMIPMAHGVDSLNVAAASAVAFWAVR
ncbi:TrmH family RNA methyltransferase [Butyrivibrio sp. VCD2006]|uniref:TrmH family RNA methyltransferase n=1 Tax=Butyrivibrio sp. VCD2006 TaxID=1280664 RepID=UPI0003FE3C53|nr:RNA methyltransferase [Butyrivibrio sp. VCD2006]